MSLGTGSGEASSRPVRIFGALVVIALVLVCHAARLQSFPPVAEDEGGWSLAVRLWITEGTRTPDYFKAPGYHWMLGPVFRIATPTLATARAAAVVCSCIALGLFYGTARRLKFSPGQALWAVAFLGTCYAVVLVNRRAYIEPFQLLWLHAVVFTALGSGFGSALALAVCTTGLLLTKATGGFIVPALVIAALQDGPRLRGLSLRRRVLALCAGVVGAAGAFYLLYRADPATFAAAWGSTLAGSLKPDAALYLRVGRFAVDPVEVFESIRTMTEIAPFLFVLGLAGVAKFAAERRYGVVVWWAVISALMLFAQAWRLENYLAVLYPALALAACAFILESDASPPAPPAGRRANVWRPALLGLAILYSLVRIAGGMVLRTDQTARGLEWLAARVSADDCVLAAPHVLMRLTARPVSFFGIGAPFLPDRNDLNALGVRWVVLDTTEWLQILEADGITAEEADAHMAALGTLAHATEVLRIYDVGRPPAAADHAAGTPG